MSDKVVSVFTGQDANGAVVVDTAGYGEAQVTIWSSAGTPDGTVTVYHSTPAGAPLHALASYATPTTAKTFRGPVGTAIVVALSGHSTGEVSAVAVLK